MSIKKLQNTLDKLQGVLGPVRLKESDSIEGINRVFTKEWAEEMNRLNSTPEGRRILKKRIDNQKKFEQRTQDPIEAASNEVSGYLSPEAARLYGLEFYQKQLRSNTLSTYDGVESEFEDYSSSKFSADDWDQSSQMFGGNGLVVNDSRFTSPERQVEMYDTLAKLINSPDLNHNDKLILLTYLYLGTGPGLKAMENSSYLSSGFEFEKLLRKNDMPKEWFEIKNRIKELEERGMPLTRNNILEGGRPAVFTPLVSSRAQLTSAIPRIQAAANKLFGSETMEEFKTALFGESLNQFPTQTETTSRLGEAKNAAAIARIASSYLAGKTIKGSEMISLIVAAVASNIQAKTFLTKSKIFSGTFKETVANYLKLAKSTNEIDQRRVFDMVLLPGISQSPEAKQYIKKFIK